MRRMNVPPEPRASSQLKSAVRALPTCSWPVGLGAKRSLISFQAGPKGPALLSVPVCRVLLDPADECYRMNRYGFASACRVDALVGLALHAHLARVDTKRRRKAGAHGIDVRHELRPLGNDDHVDVPHRVAGAADDLSRARPKDDAVRALPLGIRVGKMPADIAGADRAEHRIGHGVTDRVRI